MTLPCLHFVPISLAKVIWKTANQTPHESYWFSISFEDRNHVLFIPLYLRSYCALRCCKKNAELNVKSYLNHKILLCKNKQIITTTRKKINNRKVVQKSIYYGNECSGFSSQLCHLPAAGLLAAYKTLRKVLAYSLA